MKEFFSKIEGHFKRAASGEEDINNVIWIWGAVFYVLSFFVIDKLIKAVNLISFDIVISSILVSYFIWHLYILKKCSPKKPELSKEEKKRLKEEAHRNLGKKFLRKLFLQEPLTKTNPIFVSMVIDLFLIAHFGGYIF